MDVEIRSGWWTFAGIMVMISGFLNVIDGLVAITKTRYFDRYIQGHDLPITNNIKAWGWGALIIGVILVLAGLGILTGASWARVVGIVVASLNLLYQFTYLDHSGWWSFIMIVIDILVIYGLAGHRAEQVEET